MPRALAELGPTTQMGRAMTARHMVEHIVWFKFRGDLPQAELASLLERLAALGGQVPGIRRLCVGRNFSDRARGFTHGLVVTLDSREALADYQVHPAHAALARDLRAASDDIVALDFEV